MKKTIKNRKEIIIFIVIFIIMLVIFLPWIKGHLATDTYNLSNIGYKEAAVRSLNDGRGFMYIIGNIAYVLNVPIKLYVSILLILAIIISTLSVMLLRRIILQYMKENSIWDIIIIILLSYATIYNFMYIENLYFVECFVMSISVYINTYVANIMINEKKKYIIKAIILIILSVFMYQGTIGFFIAMYILLLLLKNPNNIKTVIRKFIESVFIISIAIIINILFVKIICMNLNTTQMRMGSIKQIPKNIIIIFKNLPIIIQENCGLFPKNLLLIFIVLISTLTILTYIKKDRVHIINYFIILIVTVLSGFCTYILSLTSFYTGRLRFSIGALIGILLIYLFCNMKKIKRKNLLKIILSVILLIYTAINIINYVIIINEHIRVNSIEKNTIIKLGKEIEEYENKNSCEIQNVYMVLYGSSNKVYDKQIKLKSVVTYNAVHCSWSSSAVINYYLGKNYRGMFILKQQYEEIIEKNKLEDKEFVFIDNSIFVKIYMQ